MRLLILLCLIVHLTVSAIGSGETSTGVRVPDSLISPGEDDASRVLLVEKSTQRLYLYDKGFNIIKTYQVTTGRNAGSKEADGDEKTPEGVYFCVTVNRGKGLPAKYGIMALPLNYPNYLDATKGRNGYGIWIHATDQPTRPLKPFDTKGCIVLTNEEMAELAMHIRLQATPVVIVDRVGYSPLQEIQGEAESIKQFLKSWERNWEEKRLNEYMDSYSVRFRSNGKGREEWKRYKNELNRRYATIDVSIRDINILRQGDFIIASFVQDYRSDGLKSMGTKRLYIGREGRAWKIIGEEWAALPKQDLAIIVEDISHPGVKKEASYKPGKTKG